MEEMVRFYGKAPYHIVLVHGGPGAIGSLKGFAKELSDSLKIGVIEALQSKYSIAELVEELYGQISNSCTGKVVLIGHSWGAWLVAFLASKHPELVGKIILVGCGPLEDKYVSQIGLRRTRNLSEDNKLIYQRLINNCATDEDMARIPKVFEQSDNYCLERKEFHSADKTDSKMHNEVWNEAAGLRTSGELLAAFKQISCRIYLIQGAGDPHPVNGVAIPLQENNIECQTYVLERCGHSPFMEKYAKEEFYKILKQTILS